MNNRKNILITGASGFVGQNIFSSLKNETYHNIFGTCKSRNFNFSDNINLYDLDLLDQVAVKKFFQEFDFNLVIHCAAIAHQNTNSESEICDGAAKNEQMIKNIIYAMENVGCKSIIFMSSIGVYGDNSLNSPFNENDIENPFNIYTNSKLICEKIITSSSCTRSIILRLPLVYGKSAPGNFQRLKQIILKAPILVFGNATNKRSYLYINNLTDLIKKICNRNININKTYNVADLETISTKNLIYQISKLHKRDIYNLKFNKTLIYIIFKLLRRENDFYRIYNSLELDISKVMRDYNWHPKYSISEGLKQTLIEFKA